MLFTILGTVNRDRIVTRGGERHESLGGILYNALALARCVGAGDRIRPVARLGEADRAEALDLLGGIEAIDPSGLVFAPGLSNEAVLEYTGPDDRTETLVDRVGPFSDGEVLAAGRADFLLANLISGWDFTPGQLARAARGGGARVLLDIQSLTLAPPGPDGRRAPRAVPDWAAWCAPVEILKGNRSEVGWFLGRTLGRPEDYEWAAERVLAEGPRVLVITLGGRGAYVASAGGMAAARRSRGRVIPAAPGVRVADPTGCGDAFASGFLAEHARGGDPLRAVCAGNAIAALVAARQGLRALRDLPDPAPLAESLVRAVGED